MANESRMTFVTSPEMEQRIKAIANRMDLSASKTINKMIETAITLDIERIWKLQQAEPVTNYPIISKITEVIKAPHTSS